MADKDLNVHVEMNVQGEHLDHKLLSDNQPQPQQQQPGSHPQQVPNSQSSQIQPNVVEQEPSHSHDPSNNNENDNKKKKKEHDQDWKVKAIFADMEHKSRSVFQNEATAAKYWLAFITVYWTLGIWIPILMENDFVQPGFITWCLGAIGMSATCYTLREGKYPSGSSRDNPNDVYSVGRYSATMLVISIIIDLAVISYYGFDSGGNIGTIIRGSLHLISLLWASLFFYNRFRENNPDVASTAFWSEWIDMAIAVIVILYIHNTQDVQNTTCFNRDICITYFVFTVVQLVGWELPMMLIPGWGSEKGAKNVCLHLFILDLCSDLPVVVTVLYNNTYKLYPIVFFDAVWKTCLLIRSTSYYVVFQIWLGKGKVVYDKWTNEVNTSGLPKQQVANTA